MSCKAGNKAYHIHMAFRKLRTWKKVLEAIGDVYKQIICLTFVYVKPGMTTKTEPALAIEIFWQQNG